ncbi:MAG: hypothetical protein LQ344_007295 [Seirophora lacunosa]|nr:MAG: hypothetical protein LQ344_007295 [Seirophora lacunosa]
MDAIKENIVSQKRSAINLTMRSGVASAVKIWNRTSTAVRSSLRAVKETVTNHNKTQQQDTFQTSDTRPAFSCACSNPETRVDESAVEELTTLVAACEGAAVPVYPNRLLKRVTGPSVCWIYSIVELLYRTVGHEVPSYFDCILWKSLLLAVHHCELILVPPVVPIQMSEAAMQRLIKSGRQPYTFCDAVRMRAEASESATSVLDVLRRRCLAQYARVNLTATEDELASLISLEKEIPRRSTMSPTDLAGLEKQRSELKEHQDGIEWAIRTAVQSRLDSASRQESIFIPLYRD